MKKTTLIRIFALFPFFGILIPDASIALCDLKLKTPESHVITCIGIIIIVATTFLLERFQSRLTSTFSRLHKEA